MDLGSYFIEAYKLSSNLYKRYNIWCSKIHYIDFDKIDIFPLYSPIIYDSQMKMIFKEIYIKAYLLVTFRLVFGLCLFWRRRRGSQTFDSQLQKSSILFPVLFIQPLEGKFLLAFDWNFLTVHREIVFD